MRQNNTPLIVGRIGGVYGVRGWLKISSFTRPEENIFSYSPWLLTINNIFQEIGFEEFQKRGERFLVKFLGIDSPEDASQYVNCDIAISEEQLPRLKKGEYYWRDLIALKVINKDGTVLGEVSDIIETGANDVIVITNADNDNQKILIPFVTGVYIHKIDLIAQTISVDWIVDD